MPTGCSEERTCFPATEKKSSGVDGAAVRGSHRPALLASPHPDFLSFSSSFQVCSNDSAAVCCEKYPIKMWVSLPTHLEEQSTRQSLKGRHTITGGKICTSLKLEENSNKSVLQWNKNCILKLALLAYSSKQISVNLKKIRKQNFC